MRERKKKKKIKLSYVRRHISPRLNSREPVQWSFLASGLILFRRARKASLRRAKKRKKNRGNEGWPASFSVVSFLPAAAASKGRIRLPPTRLNRRHSSPAQDNLGRCLAAEVRVVDTFHRNPVISCGVLATISYETFNTRPFHVVIIHGMIINK